MINWIDQFHFLRPLWLLGLLALPLLGWWAFQRRSESRSWARVCDPHLLPHLLQGDEGTTTRWPLWAMMFASSLALIALAGPVWEQRPQPLYRGGDARVIVLDLSRSMLATDVSPSRLERARYKIADLLNDTDEGQVGLVVFAGDAFVVSPLTDDANTVLSMLDALTPDIMPSQGAKASKGLTMAQELLQQAGATSGQVLLVADDVDAEAGVVAEAVSAAGYRVSVLGVGTRDGAPIPLPTGGFLERANGDIVIPRLSVVELREVAALGGGIMETLRADNSDLERLAAPFDWSAPDANRESTMSAEAWREEGPWLVLLLLPFAALAFRRGWVACLALVLIAPPERALASAWSDLWQRPDQQAQLALNNSEPEAAATLAEDPWLKGTAQFKAEDYAGAAQSFADLDTADGHYNRGNALAKLNQIEDAIAAYEEALSLDPNLEDAAFNKSLLEQQQQEQQQNEKQENQDQEQDPSESGDEGESQEDGESDQEGEQPEDGDDSENPQDGDEQEPEPGEEGEDGEGPRPADEADPLSEEERQAVEQWLRRIPDDPGGLLRRKFLLQYRQRGTQEETDQPW